MCPFTPFAPSCYLWQVIPASVRSVPPDGTAERPVGQALPTDTDLSAPSLEQERVVQDGHIVHWPGFEALMHYALYQQVSAPFAYKWRTTLSRNSSLSKTCASVAGLANWRGRQCDYAGTAVYLKGQSVCCNHAPYKRCRTGRVALVTTGYLSL